MIINNFDNKYTILVGVKNRNMTDTILNKVQKLLSHPLQPIHEINAITHEDFYRFHIKRNEAVLLTNMMDSWKAKNLWSIDYFEKIGTDKQAYSYKGNIRQDETNWQYGNFLDYLNDIKNYNTSGTNTYLGNMPIAKMFPELLQHVDFSLITKNTVRNSTSLWIGPPGTITGWHTDRLANNILAQIKGRKLVFLVPPQQTKNMYPSSKYEPGSRLSNVNMEDFKSQKTPNFKHVNVRYAIVQPGQMLFIPQNWWHCVYGIDISISSNNFGFTPIDNFKMKFTELVKRNLHSIGLFGNTDCVCHYYDESGKRQRR